MTLERILWKIAKIVLLTVNAEYAGFFIGLWWKGRLDLWMPLGAMLISGGAVIKILTFREARRAKELRGEVKSEWKLPPPQESRREW